MGDISAGLTDMWRSVLLFLPKAVAFVAILVVGWIIARAARKLVDRSLERIGFDRAVRRGGVGRALARSNYDASDILARLAYYGLLLLTLQLAFGVWGPNPVSDLIAAVVAWLPKAFVAIVIVVVAAAIASAVKDLITGALGGLSYGRMVANVASWFIIGLGVIAALNQVGIATTVTTPVLIATLATVAGILIVGVGGGLVRPMAQRWDRWLDRAESESQIIKEQARSFTNGLGAGRDDLDREMVDRAAAEPTQPLPAADTTQVLPRTQEAGPLSDAEPTQPLPAMGSTAEPAMAGAPGRSQAEADAGIALVTGGEGGAPTGESSYEPTPDTQTSHGPAGARGTSGGRGGGRTKGAAGGRAGKGGRGGAATGQSAFEPRAAGTEGGGKTYESRNAAEASPEETQRIDPRDH